MSLHVSTGINLQQLRERSPFYIDEWDIHIRNKIQERLPSRFGRQLVTIYNERKYDEAPKTREEANALNVKGYNGLHTHASKFAIHPDKTVRLITAPARYNLIRAYQEHIQAEPASIVASPHFLGAGLYAIVAHEKQYYLIGHIKGNDIAEGQVHPILTGGGVLEKDFLTGQPPLQASLLREAQEELRWNINIDDITPPRVISKEKNTGNLNFQSLFMHPDLPQIAKIFFDCAYAHNQEGMLQKMEIGGLALIPISPRMIHSVTMQDGKYYLDSVKTITFSEHGTGSLQESRSTRILRPQAVGLLAALTNTENFHKLLEYSGH